MKKEIIAILLLALLFLGSLYNIHVIEDMVTTLEDGVSTSFKAAQSGDFDKARILINEAATDWLSRDGYTHIFIRHAEINATNEAFFDYISDICAEDIGSAEGSYGLLISQLDSLKTMEEISFGSIF